MSGILVNYLNYRKRNIATGIVIFKPGFLSEHISQFQKTCSEFRLTILKEGDLYLMKDQIIALYPKIFSDSSEDFLYEFTWKIDTINYLSSDKCYFYLITGENVFDILSKFKYSIRHKYNKISHPENKLNQDDFRKNVIENILHVVDEHEIQNILWLLFYNNN